MTVIININEFFMNQIQIRININKKSRYSLALIVIVHILKYN